MSEKHTLRQKAREAIRDRKMPRRYPDRLWGGPGTGARCAVCDEPVEADDIEFELEIPSGRSGHSGHDSRGDGNPRVHTRCFSEWEGACRDLEEARATGPSRGESSFPASNGILRGSS